MKRIGTHGKCKLIRDKELVEICHAYGFKGVDGFKYYYRCKDCGIIIYKSKKSKNWGISELNDIKWYEVKNMSCEEIIIREIIK